MLDRSRWAGIIDHFIRDLSSFNYCGRNLDVRENVKFYGRQYCQDGYMRPTRNQLAFYLLKLRKFFMDEWTGLPDEEKMEALVQALQSTIPGIIGELNKL